MNILPQPQKFEKLGGEYIFAKGYRMADRFSRCASYLKTFAEPNGNAEEIDCIIDNSLKDEEYILEINCGVKITAKDECGIFRALSSLKQLIAYGKCENMRIHDYPDIKKRGLMLDISRGKVPKLDTLLEIVSILSDLKYNQLQLYMDGIVFEYAHFKEFVNKDGALTIDEIKRLSDYCSKLFIELVPNQNGFGHMEKWLEKPELSELGIKRDDGNPKDTLNPLDGRAFEFIDTLYSDLLPYFDSEYVNVGMDETVSLGMGQTKEYCDKHGKINLYIEYLNKIIGLTNKKYGKKAMIWDDILFKHPEYISKLDKNSVVMDWGYEAESPFPTRCEFLKENGLPFYTCPGTSTWGSITGRFDNMIYNVESAAASCILNDGEGILLTEWGDGGSAAFSPMCFLPYIFTACCAWHYNVPKFSISYSKQESIVRYCEEYADKFIFGGNKVSELLHMMANYYLLENLNRFNGTYIISDTEAWCKDKMPENDYSRAYLSEEKADRIKRYMEEIRTSLTKLDKNTPYIDEIICNCDMVIIMADFIIARICGHDNGLKLRISELKERFEKLWKVRSKSVGCGIFMSKLDEMAGKL